MLTESRPISRPPEHLDFICAARPTFYLCCQTSINHEKEPREALHKTLKVESDNFFLICQGGGILNQKINFTLNKLKLVSENPQIPTLLSFWLFDFGFPEFSYTETLGKLLAAVKGSQKGQQQPKRIQG